MSTSTSSATGRRYGLDRVCAAWGVPRSSHYAERNRRRAGLAEAPSPRPSEPAPSANSGACDADQASPTAAADVTGTAGRDGAQEQASPALAPASDQAAVEQPSASQEAPRTAPSSSADRAVGSRGPKPRVSDARVLVLVREDLLRSPFRGEGHRKVFARLRRAGHPVFARQVLRVMRGAKLLSPHRAPQGEVRAHDGTIVTQEPDRMWGTDGLRVETACDGWVWIFTAVEHWNAEVMGWHVTKKGDRFAALEPLKQGLATIGRGTGRGAGQGLSVRMDHGTQYTSEHFRQEVKFWGVELSYGYVAEPQTNGVAERFNRTLKEQAIQGRLFRNLEDVRQAVTELGDRYNQLRAVQGWAPRLKNRDEFLGRYVGLT